MESTIRTVIENYSNWTENEWCKHILEQDRFYRYFSKEQCDEFVMMANKVGTELALKLKADKEYSPEYFMKEYGLEVKLGQENDFLMPGVINFAQYHAGTITLSKDYIEVIEQSEEQLKEVLGLFNVKDLMFYHELFHYFEEQDPTLENAGIKIRIQPLPLIKRTVSPDCIGEMAAFAFSKEMAGIDFHPCLLEKIWLHLYSILLPEADT